MSAGRGDAPPRYSARPLPPARYVPGQGPHPSRDPRRRDPAGHPEAETRPLDPDRWRQSEAYRYAIDLHNAGYWWECHEVLESLWRSAGRDSPTGRFLQALLWIAAAELKSAAGAPRGARRLAAKAVARLGSIPGRCLGVEVSALRRRVESRFAGCDAGMDPVWIELA